MIHKDDQNMVPEWAINQMMDDERTVQSTLDKKKEFAEKEPDAYEYIEMLISSDIDKTASLFPEIFNATPKLRKTFYFMLWRSIIRGWMMADSKWKCNLLPLPGESRERNPSHYMPDSQDFL